MIVKQVPKSSGQAFRYLVDYICGTQGNEKRVQRVVLTNCISHSVENAILEIEATQKCNRIALNDKSYHLVISFAEDERPEIETMAAIEQAVCNSVGLGEHQRVSVIHGDTDNYHVHIAVSKIHPKSYRMREPYFDQLKLGEVAQALEEKYNLLRDNHTRSVEAKRDKSFERFHGIESMSAWIHRTCAQKILAAKNWSSVHEIALENGLAVSRVGRKEGKSGLVFVATNGTICKASSVDKELSLAKLEKRLGQYEPSTAMVRHEQKVKRSYISDRKFASPESAELYKKYAEEQKDAREKMYGALSARQRLLKHLDIPPHMRRFLMSRAKEKAQVKNKKDLDALEQNSETKKYVVEVKNASTKSVPTYKLWLANQAAQGNKSAQNAIEFEKKRLEGKNERRRRSEQSIGNAGRTGRTITELERYWAGDSNCDYRTYRVRAETETSRPQISHTDIAHVVQDVSYIAGDGRRPPPPHWEHLRAMPNGRLEVERSGADVLLPAVLSRSLEREKSAEGDRLRRDTHSPSDKMRINSQER